MIGDGWPTLTKGRKFLLLLAGIGLTYLIWQTQPSQPSLSRWSGNPFAAASVGAVKVTQSEGIFGEAQPLVGRGDAGADTPMGNPLGLPNTVMTQGYGVGSHAPANIWGAVDLAVDGNGDGQADPDGTFGTPVYATHDGVSTWRPTPGRQAIISGSKGSTSRPGTRT